RVVAAGGPSHRGGLRVLRVRPWFHPPPCQPTRFCPTQPRDEIKSACHVSLEVLDGPTEAFLATDLGIPPEQLLGQRNVGSPLLRVVGREGLVDDRAPRPSQPQDLLGELP